MRRCYTTVEEMKGANVFLNADCRRIDVVFRVVARWLVVSMRHQYFTGISETNAAMQQLIAGLNSRQFRKLPGASRRSWFEVMERSYLTALPTMPSDREFWLNELVTSGHVNIDKHYYSVPPTVIGQHVDVKVTPGFVEIFFQGRQVTVHNRQNQPGRSSTKMEHVRSSPQTKSEWSPQRVHKWAEKIGPATAYLVDIILTHANSSSAGIRSCLGLLALESEYGRERLESACRHAASLKSWTVGSIRSMLKRGFDQFSIQLPIPNLDLSHKTSCIQKRR